MNNEAIIIAVITGVLTYFGTKKQTEYQLKGKKVEAEANTEGMYVQNMSLILAEYKEQVSGFRDELKVVRKENAEIKQAFATFKDEHYRKIEEYKVYVAELEEEIDMLKDERNDLKLEISYLKGENDG